MNRKRGSFTVRIRAMLRCRCGAFRQGWPTADGAASLTPLGSNCASADQPHGDYRAAEDGDDLRDASTVRVRDGSSEDRSGERPTDRKQADRTKDSADR